MAKTMKANAAVVYDARMLAALPEHQLWEIPEGWHKVRFDDGVVDAIKEETIVSVYMWGFYNACPNMPTSVNHHIQRAMVNMETHREYIGRVYRDALPYITFSKETAHRLIYEQTNRFYNTFICELDDEPTTLSILDFMELIHHPVIAKANEEAKPTKLSIEQTYRIITDVLKNDDSLKHNPIAIAARNGLVSVGQILQCIAPRGFVTDIDSNIFRHPVMYGSVHGYRKLEDSLKESRSASKAASFTDEPLQYTEFFNRRLQLMATVLKNLHPGDCGTEHYMSMLIKTRDDLRDFAGKYYLNDEGKLQIITRRDNHLIGQILKVRSVAYCMHPDPQGKCEICYGQMALSIPTGTNIGHVAATSLGEKISQKVLSVKHEDKSSSAGGIELSEYDASYIAEGAEPNELKLNSRLFDKEIRLIIDSKQAEHLQDVQRVGSVEELPLEFVSKLRSVILEIGPEAKPDDIALVHVSMGTRLSSMTHELLNYIRTENFTVRPGGEYCIDLAKWDFDRVLFVLPMRHMNMLDYAKSIDRFIKSSDAKGRTYPILKDYKTFEAALASFHELVSSELSVNIVHLEVLIASCMVRSIEHRDYRLPLVGNQVQFAKYSTLMARRSLSMSMTFQDQKRVLNAPSTYLIENRPDGVMDQLFREYGQNN